MQKKILVMLSGCMLFPGLKVQDNFLNEIFRQVELNNKEFSALAFIKSKQAELYTTDNLPETEIRGYYLPLGNHNSGNYSEVHLNQSLSSPPSIGQGRN